MAMASGYLIFQNSRTAFHARLMESSLKRIITKANPTVVIDVGGNKGQYRALLRKKVGYDGPICTFEPIKSLAEKMKKQAETDHNWHIFSYALGAENGEKNFNVMETSSFSSFLAPSKQKVNYPGNTVSNVQIVTMRRLDSLAENLAEYGSLDRIFLKMDTQGFDLEVFAGAAGLHNRLVGLQSEVSVLPIYSGMPSYTAAIATYESSGFEIAALCPVNFHEERVVEFDCLFLKDLAAAQAK